MSQVAFVTGSSRGIGRGIALKLAEEGYDVAVHCGFSRGKAEAVAEEIRGMGRDAIVVMADVRDLEQFEAAFNEVVEHFGHIDVFVNNAGIAGGMAYCPFLEVTPAFFENLVNNDFRSYYFAAQWAAKNMIANKVPGRIINISSVNADVYMPEANLYGPLKLGINKLTKHLAMELAPYEIRVNYISPGAIAVDEAKTMTPRLAQWRDRTPLKRIGYPEDIAEAAAFLASPKNVFLTGSGICIDGASRLPYLADNIFVDRVWPVFERNF